MKRLYLLRHADSGMAKAGQDDRDRALSAFGRDSAARLGHYMRTHGHDPMMAHCSPAQRTRETWSIIRELLDTEPAEHFPPGLYLAEPQTLLETVRAVDDIHSSTIVIAHNPGILALALGLATDEVRASNPYGDYPAAALAVFDFAVGSWSGLEPGAGALAEFTRADALPPAP